MNIEYNFPIFYFILPFVIIFFVISIIIYKKFSIKNIYKKTFLIFPITTFIIAFSICNYLTTFSFEKWQEKPQLRQFIASDFKRIQAHEIDCEYLMSNYYRVEAKKLLSTPQYTNTEPGIKFTFVDSSEGRFSADIYYGYRGLDGIDYWLVVTYFGTDPNEKTDTAGAEILPEGTDYQCGKTIYVEDN